MKALFDEMSYICNFLWACLKCMCWRNGTDAFKTLAEQPRATRVTLGSVLPTCKQGGPPGLTLFRLITCRYMYMTKKRVESDALTQSNAHEYQQEPRLDFFFFEKTEKHLCCLTAHLWLLENTLHSLDQLGKKSCPLSIIEEGSPYTGQLHQTGKTLP